MGDQVVKAITFIRLPHTADEDSTASWVDPGDILAIIEQADGSDVYIAGLSQPVSTVLDGRAIFDQMLDDYVRVTS